MSSVLACLLSDCAKRAECPSTEGCLRMADFWKLMPPASFGVTYRDFIANITPHFISDEDFVFSLCTLGNAMDTILIENYQPLIVRALEQSFGRKFNVAFRIVQSYESQFVEHTQAEQSKQKTE